MIAFTNLTSKPVRRAVFKKLYRAIMPKNFVLSVVFAPPALMKKLNKAYRGENKAANVLSFSLGRAPGRQNFKKKLGGQGEIFLNATERNLSHLFVHGCLHFLGYGHKTNRNARRMEEKEHEVLKRVER